MVRSVCARSLVVALMGCGAPGPGPGGGPDQINLVFQFPAGSRCSVAAGTGVLVVDQMPGAVAFPLSERNAPVRCTLPGGQIVDVRAHKLVPDAAEGTSTVTVFPDGRAEVDITVAGRPVQMAPRGTVVPLGG